MQNVIKQGYLKKGNSVEGGMLSGIREKMMPRKWYMLVVRDRVPFLEQYERDVDVFNSSALLTAWNLSVCTSISRTMSTTARTFPFVIVLPDELIELVPHSREEMINWSNALERTLSSLGILRNDKEEHIYSFCPAVSNTAARSKTRSSEEEDEEDQGAWRSDERLGAVGGAPPTPPPPRSQVPPIPSSSPPPIPLSRMLSEHAATTTTTATTATPPALPPSPAHHAHRGARCVSPSEAKLTNSAPASPHVSAPLTPPTAASRGRPFSIPLPPLPRGRPPVPSALNGPSLSCVVVSLSSSDQPPPLPPARPSSTGADTAGGGGVGRAGGGAGRAGGGVGGASSSGGGGVGRAGGGGGGSVKERSLPPIPSLPTAKDNNSISSSNSRTEPRPVTVANESEEEEEDSDFVSGPFWEINRKMPVPSARHAQLPIRLSAAVSDSDHPPSSGSKGKKGGKEEAGEELDEGYTELSTVSTTSTTEGTTGNEYTKVNKATKLKREDGPSSSGRGGGGAAASSNKDMDVGTEPSTADSVQPSGPPTRGGNPQVSPGSVQQAAPQAVFGRLTSSSSSSMSSPSSPPGGQDPDLDVDGGDGEGNFYAPFPGQAEAEDSDVTSSSKTSGETSDENDYNEIDRDSALGVHVSVIKVTSSSFKRANAEDDCSSSVPIPPNSSDDDLIPDCMYASAAEASTLFPLESVPPLPPRQDSLWISMTDSVFEGSSSTNSPSTNQTMTASAAASSVLPPPSSSPMVAAESAVQRPIPRRRMIHPTSQPPVAQREEREESRLTPTPFLVDMSGIPPLPPPRRGISNCSNDGGCGGRGIPLAMVMSVDSLDPPPPPLPARRSQSVRNQRPMSMFTSWTGAMESDDLLPASMSESFCGSSSLSHQQIFHNGDSSAAENHLRQRMRLDRTHSVHSVISLKQSQAEILQHEMDLPGVTVTVSTRAAQGIALVDCAEAVCIVGWNQKDFPSLHGKFHIGDQLVSVCNVKVTSAAMGVKMLKHPPLGELVEMLVRRTPHARVLAIRRSAEGQNIGIKRNGGTAEILYVDPNGLAAENGLPLHAPGVLSDQSRANWVLTEINSRHLNLFFKDNEIDHRLNAVGREITIVVQPSDYISELKKQLKKMKNHKNYIVQ